MHYLLFLFFKKEHGIFFFNKKGKIMSYYHYNIRYPWIFTGTVGTGMGTKISPWRKSGTGNILEGGKRGSSLRSFPKILCFEKLAVEG
jgi:hypothetical protein